jgi:membrane-bound metal-dependent hydrolase YbcI (DUF457 family)
MDVVSHGLCGVLLVGFDGKRRLGPGAKLAATIGALAPDCDLVIASTGWDRYLQYHEAGTHTLLASPIIAAAVALCVRLFLPQSHFARLWCAALLGVLVGHLGLDLISGADMMLFAPFWSVHFSPHLVAMGDVLVIGIFIAGFVIALRHPKAAVWCTAAALFTLIAVKQQTQRMALADFGRPRGSDPARIPAGHPDAVNGSIFRWTVYEAGGDALRVWTVDARTGARAVRFERRTDPDLGGQAAAVPAIRAFIGLLHVPVVRIETVAGRRFVMWSDLRDCTATSCDVSVGAEIDPAGVPIRQVMEVGPLRQSRAIPSYGLTSRD